MKPVLLVQLALAAAVGYLGGHLATSTPPEAVRALETSALPSARAAAPEPAPPAGFTTSAAGAQIVTFRAAVARAAPSVVTVHSARIKGSGPIARHLLVKGLGSGVIIDRAGYVVTNDHVIKDATELVVALADGSLQPTRVVGTDPDSDLALLKIEASGLQEIVPADINSVAVGDVVLAVGNPFGVGQTVTQGIISAVGRKGIGINPVENFLQTDAAINPGNSGGALVDTAGRLIGINSAILSGSGGSQGVGFAIPVDIMQKVVASLKKNGRVARGWLGLSTTQPERGEGALVIAVESDGPADRAGIRPGDTIIRVGDKDIRQPEDLTGVVLETEPGTRVRIDVAREGKKLELEVAVAPRPSPKASR